MGLPFPLLASHGAIYCLCDLLRIGHYEPHFGLYGYGIFAPCGKDVAHFDDIVEMPYEAFLDFGFVFADPITQRSSHCPVGKEFWQKAILDGNSRLDFAEDSGGDHIAGIALFGGYGAY